MNTAPRLHVSAPQSNDLLQCLAQSGYALTHYDDPVEAVRATPDRGVLLLLARNYPHAAEPVSPATWTEIERRGLRAYVEFPAALPGAPAGPLRRLGLERVVCARPFGALAEGEILAIPAAHLLPYPANEPLLAMGKVAGYRRALFGLPDDALPLLWPHGSGLVAATALSRFVSGRFGPHTAWLAVWQAILARLCENGELPKLHAEPQVRPSYTAAAALSPDAERQALERGSDWFRRARLFVHPDWEAHYADVAQLRSAPWPADDRVAAPPPADWPVGDGSRGLLEGPSAAIRWDGVQGVRWWRRFDCCAEVAGALAQAGALLGADEHRSVARRLTDWLLDESILAGGERMDPAHPAYGLFGWNDVPRYWRELDGFAVYYADDIARGLLGLLRVLSAESEAGAAPVRHARRLLLGLVSLLDLTNAQGYLPNRIDGPDLVSRGRRHYAASDAVSLSPHFQSYMWACFLWGYKETGYPLFLERARAGIARMMAGYPDEWRWTNGLQQERARMLLPLAWLIQVDDRPLHRQWLERIAADLLAAQDACGAIREELGDLSKGGYGPPQSNADYGKGEASLIQQNGDPACDLLYTSNFAFVGLHEAACATGERRYREAADALAGFLIRVQARSDDRPELDGAWLRAFDFRQWDYWASNADIGWGAWCCETGWTQGEILATFALRQAGAALWDAAGRAGLQPHLEPVLMEFERDARG
ncbi:MAG TPA: hypothetical protein VFK80_06225 [Limnochordia bacterium]|nr:hypothetical protein [Limnochordia bacterium]